MDVAVASPGRTVGSSENLSHNAQRGFATAEVQRQIAYAGGEKVVWLAGDGYRRADSLLPDTGKRTAANTTSQKPPAIRVTTYIGKKYMKPCMMLS